MLVRFAVGAAQSFILVAGLAACSGEVVVNDNELISVSWDDSESFGDVPVSGGYMRGAIGSVERIDTPSGLTGWSLGGGVEVEAIATPGGDAAMTLITLTGDLSQLQPGRAFRFKGAPAEDNDTTEDEGSIDSGDELRVDVVACSGEDVYEWDYDEPADDVIVTCTEGSTPENVEVTVIALTEDGAADVTTTFEIDPSQTN